MKKTLFLYLACVSMAFSQHQNDRNAIIKVLDQQIQAWNTGDVDAFMKGYERSDSLMFIGKNGVTYGWQQTSDKYKKGYPDRATMGTLRFDIVKIDFLSKKSCFLLGKWHLTRPEKGDIGGYYTLILKKIKGQWLIVSDHTS